MVDGIRTSEPLVQCGQWQSRWQHDHGIDPDVVVAEVDGAIAVYIRLCWTPKPRIRQCNVVIQIIDHSVDRMVDGIRTSEPLVQCLAFNRAHLGNRHQRRYDYRYPLHRYVTPSDSYRGGCPLVRFLQGLFLEGENRYH